MNIGQENNGFNMNYIEAQKQYGSTESFIKINFNPRTLMNER